MFGEVVLDHFRNPRRLGEVRDADAVGTARNPGCGDVLELSLRVAGGRIEDARFRAQGCVATVACGSRLAELLAGAPLARAAALDPAALAADLGGLPSGAHHGAALAIEALRVALAKLTPALRPP